VIARLPAVEGVGIAPGVAALAYVVNLATYAGGTSYFPHSTVLAGPVRWQVLWIVFVTLLFLSALWLVRIVFKRECRRKGEVVADVKLALISGSHAPASVQWWEQARANLTRLLHGSVRLRCLALASSWLSFYAAILVAFF